MWRPATRRQKYVVETYFKAGIVGFIAGTLLFGLFALVTGSASPGVIDPREAVVRLLIFAGAGMLIAAGVVARELRLRRG